MIFIYPCITSENVNRQIVPAASKCMEQFFLLQLQAAFNDGIIGCISEWDSAKHRYGPILTESSIIDDSKELVSESAFNSLDNVKMVVTESNIIYKNNYNKPRVSSNNSINEIIKESIDIENKLHLYRIKLENLKESADSKFKNKISKTYKSICEDIKKEHQFRSLLETVNPDDEYQKGFNKKAGELDAEKQANKDKTSKSGNGYKKAEDYKIDLTPTSTVIDVNVTYVGGSKDKDHEKRTLMIGVKVVPIQVKNFKKVNDALLDDYFSKVSENFWSSIKRNIARKLVNGTKRVLDVIGISKLLPTDVIDDHFEKKGDVVKQMITLAPSDFVNASAFKSDLRVAPMNYKFTSSVVMFNKDDLEEDVSIFSNRSAMNRLFRLGWTSFAVLDPVKEVMLFISSLDGGFLHELPYSYMFNSLQTNDIYKNESGLRNGTRPFSIRKGNFATFARSL